MIAAPVETQEWPRGQRWAVLLLILSGQVAMIFWLASRKAVVTTAISSAPLVYLSANPVAEWPALVNPTLFTLANRDGFSGKAWMKIPAQEYDLPAWNEPPHSLSLATDKLGADLGEYLKTHVKAGFELAVKPEPESPPILPIDDLSPARSTLTVEGDVASHSLLVPLKLEAWPANDILLNSEVKIAVDAEGKIFSAVLLTRSGTKDADASALILAKAARFQPWRENNAGPFRWGRLIFHWQTLAPPATNAPPTNP